VGTSTRTRMAGEPIGQVETISCMAIPSTGDRRA
jgi:hypothetical protein